MFGSHAERLHPHQAAKNDGVVVVGMFFFGLLDAVFSGEVHGKLR